MAMPREGRLCTTVICFARPRTGRGRAKQPPARDLRKEQTFGPSLNHSPAETNVGPSANIRANVMLGGKSPE